MMTPLLQYVARFNGAGRNCWVWRGRLQGELVVVLPVCRDPVSICWRVLYAPVQKRHNTGKSEAVVVYNTDQSLGSLGCF